MSPMLEAEYLRKHWEAWVDTKVPALGNRTARQAATSSRGRERLEALLTGGDWALPQQGAAGPCWDVGGTPNLLAIQPLAKLPFDQRLIDVERRLTEPGKSAWSLSASAMAARSRESNQSAIGAASSAVTCATVIQEGGDNIHARTDPGAPGHRSSAATASGTKTCL
jgi:hypothetical protein